MSVTRRGFFGAIGLAVVGAAGAGVVANQVQVKPVENCCGLKITNCCNKTCNLLEVKDSTGKITCKIDKDGNFCPCDDPKNCPCGMGRCICDPELIKVNKEI